jgi:putative oxidoreductase
MAHEDTQTPKKNPLNKLGRALGHIMLGSIFIHGGVDTLRKPASRIAVVEKAGLPMAKESVMLNATVMATAGTTFSLGIFRKLSAFALMGSLVPTTLAAYPFWKKDLDENLRDMHLIGFVRNAALFGGLLLVFSEQKAKKAK